MLGEIVGLVIDEGWKDIGAFEMDGLKVRATSVGSTLGDLELKVGFLVDIDGSEDGAKLGRDGLILGTVEVKYGDGRFDNVEPSASLDGFGVGENVSRAGTVVGRFDGG